MRLHGHALRGHACERRSRGPPIDREMETPTAALARLVHAKARKVEREAAELRRLAAQLRDTVETQDTPEVEDTETHVAVA